MKKCSIIVPEQEDAVRVMSIHKAKGLQSPVVILPFANWEIDISGARDLIWVSSGEEPFNASSAFLVKPVKALKNSFFEKDFMDECILSNIDNFNLLYVAFTRAVERLYIFCPDKGSHGYHTGKLIKEVIDSDEFLRDNQKQFGIYEIGVKEPFTSRAQKSEIKLLKPGKFVDADYQKKVVIKLQSKSLSNTELEHSLERGMILHKALSYINKEKDVDTAISKLLNEGLITIEHTTEVKNMLIQLINIPGVKDWFTGEMDTKSETEILLPGGKVLRPDRVMIKDNKAIVVDYKSGKLHLIPSPRQEQAGKHPLPEPRGALEPGEEYFKLHSEQLNHYADALVKAGYSTVDKYILYINDKKLVKV